MKTISCSEYIEKLTKLSQLDQSKEWVSSHKGTLQLEGGKTVVVSVPEVSEKPSCFWRFIYRILRYLGISQSRTSLISDLREIKSNPYGNWKVSMKLPLFSALQAKINAVLDKFKLSLEKKNLQIDFPFQPTFPDSLYDRKQLIATTTAFINERLELDQLDAKDALDTLFLTYCAELFGIVDAKETKNLPEKERRILSNLILISYNAMTKDFSEESVLLFYNYLKDYISSFQSQKPYIHLVNGLTLEISAYTIVVGSSPDLFSTRDIFSFYMQFHRLYKDIMNVLDKMPVPKGMDATVLQQHCLSKFLHTHPMLHFQFAYGSNEEHRGEKDAIAFLHNSVPTPTVTEFAEFLSDMLSKKEAIKINKKLFGLDYPLTPTVDQIMELLRQEKLLK